MEKIAKQIITAGQNKDYDELQKIISRIETNKVRIFNCKPSFH